MVASDGNCLLDLSLVRVRANILRYSHPKIAEAVQHKGTKGTHSSHHAQDEAYFAERKIALLPSAHMIKYARYGGEPCSSWVRITRAVGGNIKVAFCGYHGWHDWYLAANLGADDSLDGHLLPGLEPNGVPRELAGTSIPFEYNNLEQLTEILESNPDVGVIYMEVQRSTPPAPGFLEGVRALATQHNAVLIFDECTSGFRRSMGGLHKHYGVEPDLATFGKTLGNGYAITAVIGRESVMQAAQSSFISSTFWTERIEPTAALATLSVMNEENATERVHHIGERVQHRWQELGTSVGLSISTGGLPALANFSIEGRDPLITKTYITDQMLDKGYLASNSLYASIAHTDQILDSYFTALEPVLTDISGKSDEELEATLPAGPAHGGFRRLT